MTSNGSRVAVILLAAGSGTRMGKGYPKAFLELDGRTLVEHALERARAFASGAHIIVVVPAGFESAVTDAQVVTGGRTRHESVSAALAVVDPSVETVLVHDCARALAPAEVFARVCDAVRATGHGIVPALPVVDALKSIDPVTGELTGVIDRNTLTAVQTPQGFPRAVLQQAHATFPDEDFHDDAAVFARFGQVVTTVPGAVEGFKITHPEDLERALAVLHPFGLDLRVGTGTDVHAFGDQRGLYLAGLFWPDELELAGHSDGDSASHAIVDALLAAARLGDIGGMVGTDDPRFANARGDVFIAAARERLTAAGFEPVNVTVQIIGNRPKLAPRRVEAERILSEWVGAPVSVSATTSDGLGITGEGRGVAAVATALIRLVDARR